MKNDPTQQRNELYQAVLPPLVVSLIMWMVYKADVAYNLDLYQFGLFPRNLNGLRGIITTPLIHDTRNYFHIFENTIALLFFGTLLWYYYKKIALKVFLITWLFTQLAVWIMAKPVFHVGMSGVIYSLAFFLITGSIIRKNRQLTAIMCLIIFLYGSIFWGLFPLIPGVSWESHLFGAITGVLVALFYRKTTPDKVYIAPPIEDDPEDDKENAWWKTGVIEEPKTDTDNITIRYEYKNNNNTSTNDKS